MGFIQEAKMMLEAAEKAASSQPLRVGWLTLAKDTISAALTEAKKGVKAQDGHVVAGQTSLDDFAGAPIGPEVKVDGSGVVVTPADEAAPIEPPDPEDGEDDEEERPSITADLPTEAEYDNAIARHQGHLEALAGGIYAEDCVYCQAIAMTRANPEHGRPDTSEDIPLINDSRGIPDGEGAHGAGVAEEQRV